MSEAEKMKPHLDWGIHVQNRAKWTLEELQPYGGQWVAWSFDGTRIVASDLDPLKLVEKLDAMGIPTDEVLHAYEPGLDEPDCYLPSLFYAEVDEPDANNLHPTV